MRRHRWLGVHTDAIEPHHCDSRPRLAINFLRVGVHNLDNRSRQGQRLVVEVFLDILDMNHHEGAIVNCLMFTPVRYADAVSGETPTQNCFHAEQTISCADGRDVGLPPHFALKDLPSTNLMLKPTTWRYSTHFLARSVTSYCFR